MKKTIIAASIAAVMSAPAMAELTVYGKVHMGAMQGDENAAWAGANSATDDFLGGTVNLDAFTDGYNAKNTDNDVVDNSSRIGFKASEDLGNGMKVFAQMEFGTSPTNAVATLSARDSFIGVSGDFGKVVMGNMAAPTKAALYKVGNIHDADANNGYDSAYVFESKGDRVGEVIAYQNNFGGANVTLATVAGTTDFSAATSIGVDYSVNGLTFAAANKNTDAANGEDITIMGVSYTMGDLTVGVVNETTDGKTSLFGVASMLTAANSESDITMLSASYKMGNNVLGVSYSDSEHSIAGTDADAKYEGSVTAKTTNISLKHNLSKSANVYIAYSSQDLGGTLYDNGDTAEPHALSGGRDLTSVGISYSF